MPSLLVCGSDNMQWLFDLLGDPLRIQRGAACAVIEASVDLCYITNAKFYRTLPECIAGTFAYGAHYAEWDRDGEWVNPYS